MHRPKRLQNVFFVVQTTGQKSMMQSGLYNLNKYDTGETEGNLGLCVWWGLVRILEFGKL